MGQFDDLNAAEIPDDTKNQHCVGDAVWLGLYYNRMAHPSELPLNCFRVNTVQDWPPDNTGVEVDVGVDEMRATLSFNY